MVRKGKKEMRVVVMLDDVDMKALEHGMGKARETNMSSYIRRLIHEKCEYLPGVGNTAKDITLERI